MIKLSLEKKFLAIVVAVLILGFGLLSIIQIKRSTNVLIDAERTRLESLAIGLVKTIKQIMLTGNALLLHDWAIDIKDIKKEVKRLEVIRGSGEEAFHDNATIDDVNTRLGANVFERRTRTSEMPFFPDIDEKMFKDVIQASKPVNYINKKNGAEYITLFYPILGEERCYTCHGREEVRGVLRITVSMDKVNLEISAVKRQLGFLALSVIAALGVVLAYSIRRMVIKPIKGLLDIMTSVASGDLSRGITHNSWDEIGEMGNGLGQVILNLRGMIGKIRDTADAATNTSGRIADDSREVAKGSETQSSSIDSIGSTIEEMNASMSEIARNTDVMAASVEQGSSAVLELGTSIAQVAENAETLVTSVNETTSSIQEMSGSIKEVAGHIKTMSSSAVGVSASVAEMNVSVKGVETNAKETARLAGRVIEDGMAGMSSVEDTIAGMGKIKGLTQDSTRVIEGLSSRIDQIGKILEVIQNVAAETQLLSLNAAIIAAQAGAHGKGFAVVADEIKDMAEKTQSSTKEVAEIIEAIRSEGVNAVNAMKGVKMGVEDGVVISRKAGEALKKIVESARSSTERVMEIAKATNEQASAAGHIMKETENLAQMAQRIATATQEQSRGSEHITKAAEKMRDIGSALKMSVKEQVGANKQITQTIDGFVGMVGHVHQAIKEQNIGAGQILAAVEDVRKAARGNMEKVMETNKSIEDMNLQITDLVKDVNRFKIK